MHGRMHLGFGQKLVCTTFLRAPTKHLGCCKNLFVPLTWGQTLCRKTKGSRITERKVTKSRRNATITSMHITGNQWLLHKCGLAKQFHGRLNLSLIHI